MHPAVNDATTRFSTRVADYVKYRPGYPREVVDYLQREIGLSDRWIVADVGAGTGISAKLFLDAGCRVIGVEPNADMRQAMDQLLGASASFSSTDGTAEATRVDADSVDLVLSAQAFHWFDPDKARAEFARILKPGGWVALMWNDRDRSQPLLAEYDALLVRYCPDYGTVCHDRVPEDRIRAFFGKAPMTVMEFTNRQEFDLAGLRGRLMSSSYAPRDPHPNHRPMMEALDALFHRHQVGGRVTFSYRTRLFYGRVAV